MQSDDLGLARLVRSRIGVEFDGEAHLTDAEAQSVAAAIERLLAERDEAREAWKPFADLANDYMTDTVNIEDDVIIAGRMPRRGEEGVPPRVTFGDFRRAHLVDKTGRARQDLSDNAKPLS